LQELSISANLFNFLMLIIVFYSSILGAFSHDKE
jgi:hypothetical protein